MPLPSVEKIWQHYHISNEVLGTNTLCLNDFFLRFIGAVTAAFGSHPWMVAGSSDGVAANMTGTNLLLAQNDFHHADPGTLHSWIVFHLDQVPVYLCFDFNSTDDDILTIVMSQAGFTGGTITARPTAVDQIILNNGGAWGGRLGNGTDGGQLRGHLMYSSDGQAFRMVIMNGGVAASFLLVERPGAATPGWDDPVIGAFKGLSQHFALEDTLLGVYNFFNGQTWKSWGPVGLMPMTSSLECPGDDLAPKPVAFKFNGANEISGEYPVQRIGLYHYDTIGQRGRHGYVHDLWVTNAVLQNGDTMPDDGPPSSKQLVVIGDLVFPGDGTDWEIG